MFKFLLGAFLGAGLVYGGGERRQPPPWLSAQQSICPAPIPVLRK